MKSMYPGVYKTVKNNPHIGYSRVFSETRGSGLRKIKFWMIQFDRNLSVDGRSEAVDNILDELVNQPGVVYAGFNTYSRGRARGKAARKPSIRHGPFGDHIEVWVE